MAQADDRITKAEDSQAMAEENKALTEDNKTVTQDSKTSTEDNKNQIEKRKPDTERSELDTCSRGSDDVTIIKTEAIKKEAEVSKPVENDIEPEDQDGDCPAEDQETR